jgi:hypothetical protein
MAAFCFKASRAPNLPVKFLAQGKSMNYDFNQAVAVLERTPASLRALLTGLPDVWIVSNEGGDSWSPFDVMGHLVHLERTDWLQRASIILEHGTSRPFDPVDRFAMFEQSKGKTIDQLLDEFAAARQENLNALRTLNLSPADYERKGKHPALGEVTLGQLLASWVVHDLNHLHQIAQTMARQYRQAVGEWRQYLLILD